MSMNDEFYTLKGYQINEEQTLTPAMEDYLEMIFRLSAGGPVKPAEISRRLNVSPPSVTKMTALLKKGGYIISEKYGDISLSEKGRETGMYLIYRHDTVHRFLCLLNKSSSELEQTEKIEHFLDEKTVANMAVMTEKMIREEK